MPGTGEKNERESIKSYKEGFNDCMNILNKHLNRCKADMLEKAKCTSEKEAKEKFYDAQTRVYVLEDVIQEMWRKINGSGVCY